MQNARGYKKTLLILGLLAVLAGVAWWQRTPVLAWYRLRELTTADVANRESSVDRVIALDWAVVPGLLARLQSNDPTLCSNVEAALVGLTRRWGPEDARVQTLADEVRLAFPGFSPLGQISGLQTMSAMLHLHAEASCPSELTRTAGDLLHACRDQPALRGAALRGAALVLAATLLDRVPAGQWVDVCQGLAEQGLSDRLPRNRLSAIQLLMRPSMHAEHGLLAKVVPMLHDHSPALRRAAVAALAPARDLVGEDELLPLLHDADPEVQQLCDAALRSRGLSDEHIAMARDISDESPKARLRVIERLGRSHDIDNPSAWLRRLSHDDSPAVRAAAIRAAAQNSRTDLADRLREMALQDPSETVRQNAQFFLILRSAEK